MSLSPNRRLGQAYIHITGVGMLPSMPGASLDIGGIERTPVMGARGRLEGFSEASKPAHLKCRLSVGVGDSLGDIKNQTVTSECDTGQVYVVRGATLINTLKLETTGPGNVDVELMGHPAEEMQHTGARVVGPWAP